MLIEVVLAALAVMVTSLIGVLFVHKVAAEFLENRLSYLVSFSAGVFLVVAGALALEAFHLFASPVTAIAWIAGGYLLAWLLHFLLPEVHHHHDGSCQRTHGGARRLLVGDAIHNIADGIIIVPAFMASPVLGVAVTASIMIHESLQEISEFFVLRRAGYSTRQALSINFAVSSTILIGVVMSYFAVSSLTIEGALMAVAAGFFLHVVLHDLFPTRKIHGAGTILVEHVLILAIGVIAMASINVLLGDSHVHGENDEHAHEEPDHEHETGSVDTEHDADDHHVHEDGSESHNAADVHDSDHDGGLDDGHGHAVESGSRPGGAEAGGSGSGGGQGN